VPAADRDAGERWGLTSDEKARLKALERENRALRQANEILKKASAYFTPPLGDACIACRATGRARPPVQAMIAFTDDYRAVFGVGPICRVLRIAPSIAGR
jgi:hypothetical protein